MSVLALCQGLHQAFATLLLRCRPCDDRARPCMLAIQGGTDGSMPPCGYFNLTCVCQYSDLGLADSSMCLMRRNTYSHDWQESMYTKHGIQRLHHWKKGNQRNVLIRSHAELAVEDIRLVEAFSKDCTTCQVTTLLCEPADEQRNFLTLSGCHTQSSTQSQEAQCYTLKHRAWQPMSLLLSADVTSRGACPLCIKETAFSC